MWIQNQIGQVPKRVNIDQHGQKEAVTGQGEGLQIPGSSREKGADVSAKYSH